MGIDRRTFLKIASLSAVGALSIPGWQVFAKGKAPEFTTGKKVRWAMVIDIRKCVQQEDCNDCIVACHQIHNVPDLSRENSRHVIKWIWKEPYENAFPTQYHEYQQEELKDLPVLLLCNHCDNPPCVKVCPTQATYSRDDGIVMMDWHRCIGCRYCMAACPYGSRSFNWRDPREFIPQINEDFPTRTRGVVEKCTFCEERIVKGLPPKCVEACKEKAILFGNLADPNSELRMILKERFTLRRKPKLGTEPEIFYIV